MPGTNDNRGGSKEKVKARALRGNNKHREYIAYPSCFSNIPIRTLLKLLFVVVPCSRI
uniref:Uncharacterized protein n=1 Tax=Arundo donax TaxID=35708 RepID=A0A0A9DTI9_ARUDO